MCGSLVCHHVYYVFYYCFVCCTYPSYFPFFFLTELSWKLIKNVYLNRGPNKLMLQCPSLLHQMYMLFINWTYFICDNKLCWTWTWTWFSHERPVMMKVFLCHVSSCFITFFLFFFFRLATQSSITLTASPGYEKVLNRPTTAAAFPSRRTIRSLPPISAKAVFHITWSKVSGTTWRLGLCCWTAVCWTASSGEPQRKH